MNLDKLISVRLLEGHNDKLELIARDQCLHKADIIRRAIKDYIDKVEASNI